MWFLYNNSSRRQCRLPLPVDDAVQHCDAVHVLGIPSEQLDLLCTGKCTTCFVDQRKLTGKYICSLLVVAC